jgi:hypothetical protein
MTTCEFCRIELGPESHAFVRRSDGQRAPICSASCARLLVISEWVGPAKEVLAALVQDAPESFEDPPRAR